MDGSWVADPANQKWMRGVEIKAEDAHTLAISGLNNEAEFLELLTSSLTIPVRLDLIEKSPENPAEAVAIDVPEGWTVSLGPLRLQTLPQRPTPLLETIKLVPNENAYRGGAPQGVSLEVWRYVESNVN